MHPKTYAQVPKPPSDPPPPPGEVPHELPPHKEPPTPPPMPPIEPPPEPPPAASPRKANEAWRCPERGKTTPIDLSQTPIRQMS